MGASVSSLLVSIDSPKNGGWDHQLSFFRPDEGNWADNSSGNC